MVAAMYAATVIASIMTTPLRVSSSANTKIAQEMNVTIVACRPRTAPIILFPFTRTTFVDGIVNKSLY